MNEQEQKALSTWGKWGPGDELGAANFVDADAVTGAARLVRSGAVYSLGMRIAQRGTPISPERTPPMHFMTLDGGDFAAGVRVGGGTYQAADDYIFMSCAGTTHVDALAHFWYDDQLYNGHSPNRVRSYGATRCGIENLTGLVTRGVLLDVARFRGVEHLAGGESIDAAELEACARAAKVDIRRGDCVLIRTGWIQMFAKDPDAYHASAPGICRSAAEWLAGREISALGADNVAIEVLTGPNTFEGGSRGPVSHRLLIRDCGIYLVELMDLEELGAARVSEFLFVMAPLKIVGGVNSPVNPIAIA